MVRYGGPKWIPRGGFPRFRRRRRTAWVTSGLTDGNPDAIQDVSSLQITRANDNEGSNTFSSRILQGLQTKFVGFLVSTFDDHSVEANDQQSINQADALNSNLTVLRIQGFVDIQNGIPSAEDAANGHRKVGYLITHQASDGFDQIDQEDWVDPSLWRTGRLVHSEIGVVSTIVHTVPPIIVLRSEHHWTRNVNLRVKRRLRKNEVLALWIYHDITGDPQQDTGVVVNWAMRCLISR